MDTLKIKDLNWLLSRTRTYNPSVARRACSGLEPQQNARPWWPAKFVLPSQSGDPNVFSESICGIGEFRFHVAVPLAGALVGQEKDGG